MSSVLDGRQVVATAGTRVQLATTQSATGVREVHVTALSTNTGVVTVGGSGVVGAAATRKGVGLAAGASWSFAVDDLGDLWLDAVTNGEGVSFAAILA